MVDESAIRQLEAIVLRAGEELMKKWPGGDQSDGSLQQETKEDGSIVTEADFASNNIIVDGLKELFPDDGILSEELPREDALKDKSRVWIIDPLDGTAHFAVGRDDFSILVGLAVEGNVEFGIMYFPARKQFALGRAGERTVVNGEVVRPSDSDSVGDRRLYIRNFTVSDNHQPLVYDQPMDSGMALLSLCNGGLDGIVMRMSSHKEWDIAAPVVAIEGGGGRVSDEHGEPLCFDRGEVYFDYVVASNGRVHEELLEVIRASKAE